MSRTLVFSVLIVVSFAASASAQAPDRSAAPKPGTSPALKLPAIEKQVLSNGIPVWIVERHSVPVVQINPIVKAGSAADPAAKFGLANLTAAMLDEGAGSRDALAVADAIDYLGAELSTSSTYDASFVSLHVPVARMTDALAIIADVALRPAFGQKDLDRLREERLAGLKQTRDSPPAIAAVAFPLMQYGPSHRYGIGASEHRDSPTRDRGRGGARRSRRWETARVMRMGASRRWGW